MRELAKILTPELILIVTASVLFLVGVSRKAAARRLAPMLALAALAAVFVYQAWRLAGGSTNQLGGTAIDPWRTVRSNAFTDYVKLLTAGVGALMVLLAWPTNDEATGSRSIDLGEDVGEFFALMLLSVTGVFLVAGANDIVLLFLGIELASIPTYVMVSMSRPIPAAQEAGVKYFFLGAMAAAVMLFGFSYLYGTTGLTKLDEIAAVFARARASAAAPAAAAVVVVSQWQMLAVLMLLAGFAFKIAAVPLHVYAGDVYQGAATPVTAFLAFVPKTSGIVAIIKLLAAVGGAGWSAPPEVVRLLWVLAALTMTVGNVLGLLQENVKRVLAYSSVAHTGYMLVGLTALVAASAAGLTMAEADRVQIRALQGVLFYLAAYGIMNAGAFGVLMLLPSRAAGAPDAAGRYGPPPATSAETFEDLAGQGRRYPLLGLAMTVCCLSLIGIPLTIGFFGKFYLLQPAWGAKLSWLVIITVVNAAISAAYYLRIIAAMYLRDDPATAEAMDSDIADAAEHARATHRIGRRAFPIVASIAISVALTLLFGIILPATNALSAQVRQAAMPEGGIPRLPVPPGTDDDHGAAPATQPAPAAAALAR